MILSTTRDKLPKEVFQGLTKLREQEERMQSVLFQKTFCATLCQIARDRSHYYLLIMYMQTIESVSVFDRLCGCVYFRQVMAD